MEKEKKAGRDARVMKGKRVKGRSTRWFSEGSACRRKNLGGGPSKKRGGNRKRKTLPAHWEKKVVEAKKARSRGGSNETVALGPAAGHAE